MLNIGVHVYTCIDKVDDLSELVLTLLLIMFQLLIANELYTNINSYMVAVVYKHLVWWFPLSNALYFL